MENKKNKKPFYKRWWVWILAIIILAGLGQGTGDKKKAQKTATQQEQKKEDAKRDAEKKAKEEKEKKAKEEAEKKPKKEDNEATLITTAQGVVKKNLKSPSTAKFPWSFKEYNIQESKSDNKDMVIYTVTGYVDAENSFSAKIRNNFIVKMECTKDLSKYRVLDVNITE
ncbi:hypothetical protein FDE94_14510 [Clostridium botulinum]|nr:hypothetical protein [Clostridium botulinum]